MTTARNQALTDQFARLGQAPERTATDDELAAERAKVSRGQAMPAEQDHPVTWNARISLTTSQEMKRDLDLARVDDGIEATARIRAMISLWQAEPRHRARVDKLARTLR